MNRQHYASRFWLSFPTPKHLFSVPIFCNLEHTSWKLFTFFTQESNFDSKYVNQDVSETLGSGGNRNKTKRNYENIMMHGQL
jgi:hypothetical protein